MELFDKFPQLETENLILRQIQLSDAEAVFKIFSDASVTKYHDLDTATRLDQAQFLINRRAELFKSGQRIRWGIACKTNDVIIGSCGYSSWVKNSFRAEIGYELAKIHWQKGIMTEALRAMINFGFQEMGLNRIEARVMLENIASIRLLEKLGFEEEGILREHGYWKGSFHNLKLFSILKKSWSSRQQE
ncbi:GNAT family N-acetyltransferase [Leptolyngbya sp. FACHB-671]|uniref:GNAT family N-acetyltransferase n=1 Tax=Leptolyngbya sp. FACHB-671 TaxID=2692812 RepID=UPI001682B18D|nr:GNAT family protein [Leptolyngbya sp. FACHB-671]MBD1869082.1 GNAT family N-acetyltransferase [Cyanobacteria bacterium FACHB-471]MBD2069016.1 GNAT family N-acetyltransferase [Leptolyngbya sp. FACHB-671]